MKVYAIIPVNEAAQEMSFPNDIPALFADEAAAEAYAVELSVEGMEYAAEEVEVR